MVVTFVGLVSVTVVYLLCFVCVFCDSLACAGYLVVVIVVFVVSALIDRDSGFGFWFWLMFICMVDCLLGFDCDRLLLLVCYGGWFGFCSWKYCFGCYFVIVLLVLDFLFLLLCWLL